MEKKHQEIKKVSFKDIEDIIPEKSEKPVTSIKSDKTAKPEKAEKIKTVKDKNKYSAVTEKTEKTIDNQQLEMKNKIQEYLISFFNIPSPHTIIFIVILIIYFVFAFKKS